MRGPPLLTLFIAVSAVAGCLGVGDDLTAAGLDDVTGTGTLPAALPALLVERSLEVTAQGTGFEPSVAVGPDGAIYVTAPGNNDDRRYTRLWASHDDGASFEEVPWFDAERGVSNLPYGFEGDVAVGADGTVYFVDLTVANTQISRSTDAGRTWELRNPAVFLVGSGDREWVAAGPADHVAVVWNEIPTGFWVAVSEDGGRTFPVQTRFEGTNFDVGPVEGDWQFAGVPVMTADGTIYVARTSPDGPMLHASADGGRTFTSHLVHPTKNRTSYLMTVPAVDPDGNVYVAWAGLEDDNVDVYYAGSRDGGATWTPPVRVSHHNGSSVMPWLAAGADGHLALAYYGAPEARGEPHGVDADWYPYLVDVRDALGAMPGMHVARLSETPVLTGAVCVSGLSCNTGDAPGDRSLADYLEVAVGPDGRAHAVWGTADGAIHWAVAAATAPLA